ncbi:MAG: HD domain-containing protein [Flavobacteriaceae bacterium]|nr:HD domain-containing protein [Muriicola sp.]NNC61227.1 HD domain-containing protein [Eudoraea sp.]NNK20920.1 HD domain-containing protein [Flavobacteriaceae bacterium]MBT8291530.1 HD domain-containing protein [Muriicola sp.]NNK36734.1 HD domain-containing protein [Eudoraea sp.]
MTNTELVEATIDFVKETLLDAEAGHDWFHTQRVFKNALLISKDEKVDVLVVSLGALLHDIADSKFHKGDETVGPRMAREFLGSLEIKKKTIEQVCYIIEHISFKNTIGKKNKTKYPLELQVVQDADRLDALGAIGIARAFHYGGFKNRKLYDPDIPPDLNMTKSTYKKSESPTINHFYEKLLLLKDKMNTETGKRIASQRHDFLLNFLEQFYAEWNGDR